MNDEMSKADRLAKLRAEMTSRFAELRDLIGPERAHMLYPAEQATMRECSRAHNEATKGEAASERRALVQGDHWRKRDKSGHAAGTVSWAEHEKAWAQYDRDGHGSQSAERINERGGFGYEEITKLLGHEPTTWQARS